ncbi:MAG: AbiJ-NTD4 domain-containing protein [Candidatus Acidiferrales bacterium]
MPPFSARHRGAHAQIDSDCPESARIGLLHIVLRAVDQNYVKDYQTVVQELERIARVRPDRDSEIDGLLMQLPWDKVFDFCERFYNHLAQDYQRYDGGLEAWLQVSTKSESQKFISGELQRLFLEENLAFEFSDGIVRRRGRRNTADQISRAEAVLGDPRLVKALGHFNKALRYFRNLSQPDPENVVKEAVCAVEAAGRALFPSAGSTLGEVVKTITGIGPGQIPKPIAKTFDGLYGFRNAGDGVGHGGAEGGPATKELSEYVLAVAASQIVFLVDLAAASENDIPF